MATATAGLKWLNLLEKEFDKAFVDLDLLLGAIDEDQCEIMYEGRQKMTALSAAFAQLCHKALTVFENNGKLEEELSEMRQELCEAQASHAAVEKELQKLLIQLHSAQLQVSSQMGYAGDSSLIKQKLESEMEQYRTDVKKESQLIAEVTQLNKENNRLHHFILALQSELYGARLAAKYLDKELAGRIQQIQLLGQDLGRTDHNHLWNQLEAEIHLHRHKTVIRACRSQIGLSPKLPAPPEQESQHSRQGIGQIRTVHLTKGENEGLGISITGGREHGVPILISEIHPDQPASRSGNLFVGDAVLSVNNIDLRQACHDEAVKVLSSQEGEIAMEVVFVSPEEASDEETEDGEGEFRFRYQYFGPDICSQTSSQELENTNSSELSPFHFQGITQGGGELPWFENVNVSSKKLQQKHHSGAAHVSSFRNIYRHDLSTRTNQNVDNQKPVLSPTTSETENLTKLISNRQQSCKNSEEPTE
ncbi:Golgi-associated PDZ and coiled-coil motif-containing protein-like isoform X2 [Limulus polyphemus]|uniref:Golgi-associated PDZ and coiled-coil motif-containing protein-like isoform X2 n=1 Tax=Limulus polyphemus TaxID=6850 RepID=A0ABM1BPR1_LIMPO|nr:Golgi-associated PDZ and coiled-coil motif-containing protein-like isoform X2 [Limulus polyphemus]